MLQIVLNIFHLVDAVVIFRHSIHNHELILIVDCLIDKWLQIPYVQDLKRDFVKDTQF